MAPDQRPPETLPDPWLFDTEHLLRELARCQEMILLIPATDAATHAAIKIAINANWNLDQTLRYLLQLHSEGQRQWQREPLKPLPTVRNPTPAVRLAHRQPMQAEVTDSELREHGQVKAGAFFRASGRCRAVQPARLS